MLTETTMKPIADFVKDNQITMTVERADSNPAQPEWNDADHWRCRLVSRLNKSRMTVYFSKGYGHHGAEPIASEVLDCLAMDAAGIENSGDFTDWCNEYGYDTDSRKAERTFKLIQKQADQLRRLLGDDSYNELLWNTERL